jgi:hypothetical protein
VGANVSEIEQLADAASAVPQLLAEIAKLPAFVPPIEILVIVSAAVPELERVTVCAAEVVPVFWLPKLRDVGESAACGTSAATPVPLSVVD